MRWRLAWLLGAIGCSSAPVDPSAAWRMPTMDAPAPPAADELPPGDLPDDDAYADPFWRSDERRAVAEARGAGKGLLVDFYAAWCDRCRDLDRFALEDPIFRFRVQQRFVPLRVDVTEPTAAERDLLERYEVDRLPAVLFLETDGTLTRRYDAVVSLAELLADLPSEAPAGPRP